MGMADERRHWATDDEYDESERLAGWGPAGKPSLPFDPLTDTASGQDTSEFVTPPYLVTASGQAVEVKAARPGTEPAPVANKEPPPNQASVRKPAKVGWLTMLLFGSRSQRALEARLRSLNQTIELYPDAASNYVLRGELFLNVGEYAMAEADFRMALTLAETQFEISDWGLVEQATRDRAQEGLKRARRR